jgi:uncharacterized glyoxalase superfamily protein PhnB
VLLSNDDPASMSITKPDRWARSDATGPRRAAGVPGAVLPDRMPRQPRHTLTIVDAATGHFEVTFTAPQVILFSADVEQASAFYQRLGFHETFRVPDEGAPIHADLVLGDYKIGFASMASSREHHGLQPVSDGQRATVTLWTEDTEATYRSLTAAGVPGLAEPHVWLDRLLIAWVQDPDGHPIQLVQRLA